MPDIVSASLQSRYQNQVTALGYIAETMPAGSTSAGVAIGDGNLVVGLVGVLPGDVISGVRFYISSAASGTTLVKSTLLALDGTRLAVSASAHAAINGATGETTVSFTGSYTIPAGTTAVYVGLLCVGGTTPSLRRGDASAIWAGAGSYRKWAAVTAQSDVQTSNSLGSSGVNPLWFAAV